MFVNVTMRQTDVHTIVQLQSIEDPRRVWEKEYLSPLQASLEAEAMGLAETRDELQATGMDYRRLRMTVYAAFEPTGRVALEEVLGRGYHLLKPDKAHLFPS